MTPETQIEEVDGVKTNIILFVSLLTVLMGAGSTQTFAAEEPYDETSGVLEEVIVTARKIQENLQEVPVAINTINAETVREMNLRLLQDVLDWTPGAMHYEYSKTEQTYTIRGVGSPAEGASGDSSVLLMEDGEVISRDFMRSAKMYDVERIEVLRGPQGTTYGRNAVGGVIHTINKRPHHELESSAILMVGDYDFYSFDGVLNSGLTETTSGRLSMHYDQRDGYTTNLADGNDIDYQENIGVRAQVLFTPSESLEILAKATYEKDDDGPPPRKTYDPTIPYDSPFTQYTEESTDPWTVNNSLDPQPGLDRKVWSLGLDVNWELHGMNLISLTHYRHGDSSEAVDTYGSPDRLVFSYPINKAKVFSQELRLEHVSPDSNYRWVTGLYFLKEDTYRNENRELLTEVGGAPFPYGTLWYDYEWGNNESLGLFGEVEYDFTDRTSVALGLRYTHDKKDFDIEHWADGPLAPLVIDENPVIVNGLSKSWNATTGRISLKHNFTEASMVYGSVSTGYKAGGYGTQPPTYEAAETPYNEENVTNYEIGAKAEWLNHRLRTNIALFRMDHDDIQTQDFAPSGAVVYGNAGKARTKGIELEVQAAVTQHFTVLGSYANYKGEYRTVELANQHFANMPKWTANLSGIYELPLSNDALLRVQVDYRGRSDIWHDKVDDPLFGIQPAVNILNAKISYLSANGHWEIGLWGRNLTNEEEMININSQAFMSQRTVGYGPPRTYGLSLRLIY